MFSALKLKVFVDDITILLKGRNKELAELAQKVLDTLKKAEGCKDGKSKVIASCTYLEEKLRECNKEGVILATSVETLGVDLQTRTK